MASLTSRPFAVESIVALGGAGLFVGPAFSKRRAAVLANLGSISFQELCRITTCCEVAMAGPVWNTKVFAPDDQRNLGSVVIDDVVGTPVPGLLASRRPPHVPRLIIAVVVCSLKRMASAWALAHVFEEALKPALSALTKAPSVTDRNAATTIVRISFAAWAVAASQGSAIHLVFRKAGAAVRREVLGRTLNPAASARRNEPAPQIASCGSIFFSAVAPAAPKRLPILILTDLLDHRQAAKSAALHVEVVP